MSTFPKIIITIGVILITIGMLWQLIGRFIPLGKLPGDIFIKGENTTFYFPVVTCLIISVILSLIFMLIGRFR
ncbi:hypothetical protein AJ85_17140 [Alkalihalobacillus alcalophilus ATCC 27647 = CGMCC 1.3604]|uniref:DUF2905 domain-containing protein n=1 Tax=Alkalihalobacillus alcalophilus ATCC 27647 = CGMCC 1.3604 TaxID=1218173 RepID=A0A094WFG5_ALKAL|nr:DUF2905 domain-containing protein [Alkalihalobacillus alcalophilus]KGA96514.1 hypothetical protein BALCAV_0215810 [Alkalihalobacillus alcalophilus ATCC 27647 = CGMCC 1.3604]MED1561261.1 DUF2905 domain-containing protein [Alkalihalobacillus alcalophilus]THG89515.1 hypothetical protein AJ85_17140 [Alkalihalobacillus alcalophilus ATCC 27647 = CGMCC 1.3604]